MSTSSVASTVSTITLSASTQNVTEFVATANQTTFSITYTPNAILVFLNGILLDNGVDYTATNGTSVVLTNGAAVSDVLTVDKGNYTFSATSAQDFQALRAFTTISVSGQSDVVADSGTDILTLAAGSNMTITTAAGSDTITLASANQLTDNSVTTAILADNSVTSAKIADDAVTSAKIADDAVTSAKIADNAIGTLAIADDAVTSAKIADNAIGTLAIADDAVTADKVANDIKVAGIETIYIPAAGMYPETTNGCADLEQVELTNGPELKCLDFAAAADAFAQFQVIFPKSWNEGTVTFQAFFTVTGTNTGTVAWGLAGRSYADNADINTAFGTQVVATAKAHSGTSNDLNVAVVSGAVTIAGAAADALTIFQIARDVTADSQTGAARLLGIKIFFTTDAANDA
jgi:hypothetical protein